MPLPLRIALVATLVASSSPAFAQNLGDDPVRNCTLLAPKLGGLDACREAVRRDPNNPGAVANLAVAFAAAGRMQESVEAYRRLVELRPDSIEARLAYAVQLDRAGNVTDALEAYRAFSRLTPDEPRGNYYVGLLLLESRRYEEALAQFRRAVDLDSLQGRFHAGAAGALAGLGRKEEALMAFRTATRLRPEDAVTWGNAARVANDLNLKIEAVTFWDHAVNVVPSYFDRRPDERRDWERAIREIGSRRISVINQPVEIQSPVSVRHRAGETKSASFTGSGFWVSADGYLLTNRHVVKGCREVKVRPDSGASQSVSVVAVDGHDDLALLKAAVPYGQIAAFRSGPTIRRGEDVVAVGFPLNGLLADQVNVTVGAVSALAGIYNDNHVLQMTTPVQQGNSGGPLLDASGNVVGVVVTKLNARAMAAEIGDFPQNVNFAIKSDVARAFLDANKVTYRTKAPGAQQSHADVGDMGRVVTVLVECYN